MAAALPLAPDETYYWVWSRALAAGYPDHPPMVALWIRAGTFVLGDGPLGVRLLAPLAGALGTLMLMRAGEDLLPGRSAGKTAALLLNATLMLGVGTVTMTPDTPLMLFWTACLWALGRLLAAGDGRWWLVAGAAAGLALASKYTAVLLLPCVLLWLLWVPALRPWLRRPQPWIALLLAGLLFLPVVLWNANHDWVSFLRQGSRIGDRTPARAGQFLAELLAGQIGLATPVIALLGGAGIVLAIRRARQRDPGWTLLALMSGFPALVFLQHALGDRVQANWPAVIYPAAAIAAAGLSNAWQHLGRPGAALGFAITALVWMQGIAAPLNLPAQLDPTLMRLGGWSGLAAQITAERGDAAFIAADDYGIAAELARRLPADLPVLAVDDRWAQFNLPDARPLIAGRTGLLLRSARRDDAPDAADWAAITPLPSLQRHRDGMVAEGFRLYRVNGRTGATPIVELPRLR